MRTLFLLLIAFSCLLGFGLFVSMVGESAIDLPFRTQLNAVSFVPQGWAFFTLDAREERMLVYRVEGDGRAGSLSWRPVDLSVSQPKYLFGLNRKGRTISYELQSIEQGSTGKWEERDVPLGPAVIAGLTCDTVVSRNADPILEKELLLVRVRPVPWAWARHTLHPSYQIMKVYVKQAADGTAN
jgi:antimicrobial peptide system SdpA family protein